VNRLNEIIELQRRISAELNSEHVGRTVEVFVEGESTKSASDLCGRTDTNRMVVFPRCNVRRGQSIMVEITRSNAATLFGRARNGVGEDGGSGHAWISRGDA
jgi:tRNA-2-methylthio-N6-dimethylallyladenosine synthase